MENKFEKPVMEVITFEAEDDIITTSDPCPSDCVWKCKGNNK